MTDKLCAVIAGWCACSSLMMFRQDLLGLEKYIEYCRLMWINISPLWGAGIFALSIWWIFKILEEE